MRKLWVVLTVLLLSHTVGAQQVTLFANSVDLGLNRGNIDVLEAAGADVEVVAPEDFRDRWNDSVIIILGGHRAPYTGEVVDGILNDGEKRHLLSEPDSKLIAVVPDQWAEGQKVIVLAGYSKEQTHLMFRQSVGDLIRGMMFNDSGALDEYTLEHVRAEVPPLQPSQPYTEVNADEANAIINGIDDVMVVDVRASPYYDAGHIPGAVNIPSRDTNEYLELPRDRTYLLYCGGNSESIMAGDFMSENDFESVYRLVDGYVAWRRAGYPRERSS